jgi:molybdenum cofactor cytidylyltransferase
VVLHDRPHRNDTIRLGLEALGDLDACMFLPGDQPLLRRETVAQLLDTWKQSPNQIVRPVYEDTEGSPVLFPSWAFPELMGLPEGKGGSVVIQRHIHEVLRLSISNPFELADVDTMEMLHMLEGFCHD